MWYMGNFKGPPYMAKRSNIAKFNTANPEDAEKVPIETEVGVTGLRENAGVIDEEFLRPLMWPNATKVYREMADNDATIGAMLFAVQQLIRTAEWDIVPGGNDEEDLQRAEFVKQCINDMEKPFKDIVSEAMTMVEYGFALLEPVFKKRLGPHQKDRRFNSRFDDGKWGWRKMPVRAADTIQRWEFSEDKKDLIGVWQLPPYGGSEIFIPIERLLHFRLDSRKDNPESRSALRTAYRSWKIKKTIEEFEAIGIERDLVGLLRIWVPPQILSSSANDDEKRLLASLRNIGETIKNNEQAYLLLPNAYDSDGNKLYDVDLMSAPGDRQYNTTEIIERWDVRIAQTILADFIHVGARSKGATGSFALSSNKTKLFTNAISSWLDTVAEQFNKKAIPMLGELNGWDMKRPLPTLEHTDIETKDLEELATFFGKLISVGGIDPDEELQNFFRKTAGAPELVTNEEEI